MNPTELLEERLSDIAAVTCLIRDARRKRAIALDIAILTTPVVLRAAAAGNEQCKAIIPELMTLIDKLK